MLWSHPRLLCFGVASPTLPLRDQNDDTACAPSQFTWFHTCAVTSQQVHNITHEQQCSVLVVGSVGADATNVCFRK